MMRLVGRRRADFDVYLGSVEIRAYEEVWKIGFIGSIFSSSYTYTHMYVRTQGLSYS